MPVATNPLELLPPTYRWLRYEQGPLMLREALKLYGTKEYAGEPDNPLIMDWADEVGLAWVFTGDEVPWCGLFLSVVAKRAHKPLPQHPYRARSWAQFAAPSPLPCLGDVLVFERKGGGHVALYVGEDAHAYHCLGGNQADSVNITRIAKARAIAVRRPHYMHQPPNVRPIMLSAAGIVLSQNEE